MTAPKAKPTAPVEPPKEETPAATPKPTAPKDGEKPAAEPAVNADTLKDLAEGLKALSAELAETRKENAELRKDGEQTRADLDSLRDGPDTDEDKNPSQPGTEPTLDEQLELHLNAGTPAVIIAAITGLSAKELRAKAKKLGFELDEESEGKTQAPPEGGIGSKDVTE